MISNIGSLLTAIALVAVLIARRGVREPARRSLVAVWLRGLYTLVAALLVLRLLTRVFPSAIVTSAQMVVAAWLPIIALRLVEELRRRHAPRLAKVVVLGGALGFSVLALTVGLVWSAPAILALATYQALALALMAVLLARSRGDIAPAERRTADTFLLALVFTIPLALTDFSQLLPHAPVRGGGFAALILVLATSRLVFGDGSARQLLRDVAMLLGGAGIAVLAVFAVDPRLGVGATLALAAVAAGGTALALLFERFSITRTTGAGVISALVRVPTDASLERMLNAHPVLASGRVLGPDALAGYPDASLARILDRGVISAQCDDAETRDAARDLLDSTAATHLIRLSRSPPRLLAVAAGGLAGRALDDELEVAARLMEGRT